MLLEDWSGFPGVGVGAYDGGVMRFLSRFLILLILVPFSGVGGCEKVAAPVRSANLGLMDPLIVEAIEGQLAAIEVNPSEVSLRLRLAMLYHANGLPEEAEQAYRQVIEMDSGSARAWYGVARLHQEAGAMEEAVAAGQRVIAIDPEYIPARRRLGAWLLELGRVDEAEQVLSEARSREPGNPLNDMGLAKVMLQQGKFAEAVGLLEPVVRKFADLGYAQMLLASGYRGFPGGERMEEARLASARGAGAIPPELDPWATELLSLRTGYSGLLKESERLLGMSTSGAGEGNIDEAERLLNKARLIQPRDPIVLNNLARVYESRGKFERMRKVLLDTLRHDPDHYATHLNLSLAYEHLGNLGKARVHALRAVELNPSLGPAHWQLGRVLLLNNDREGGVAEIQEAMARGYGGVAVRLQLGQALGQLGRWTEAEGVLRESVRLYPDHAESRLWLGYALGYLGRFEEAFAEVRTARGMNASLRNLEAIENDLNKMSGGNLGNPGGNRGGRP